MKTFTKKYLLLVATIVMLMTALLVAAPAASAAECGCDNPVLVDGEVIAPTCDEEGYTQSVCSVCGTVVGKTDIKEALGHSYGEWEYVANGEHYNKKRTCERKYLNADGEWETCGAVHFEVYEEYPGTEKVVYYKVRYINPYVTAAEKDLGYAKLATSWKSELLWECYVREGSTPTYGGNTPYRAKDEAYGAYRFKGWDKALSDAKANIDVYAEFTGVEVYYDVVFYLDPVTPLSQKVSVAHGKGIDDSAIKARAVKEETVSTIYKYVGWDKDINAIYGNASVIAVFEEVPQRYLFGFYTYDGQAFRNENGDALRETCNYGGSTAVGNAITAAQIARPNDLTYIYAWTGQWQLKNRPGVIVDLDYLTVPAGTDPEVEEVQLTPVYDKRMRVYDLEITLAFPSDIAENAPSFYGDSTVIQIVNAAGQLVDGGETEVIYKNENGARVPYIVFKGQVYYSSSYHITAVTSDYKYRAEIDSRYVTDYGPTKVTLNMSLNPEFETKCGCIHHNVLLRPLWVRILNLIYNIFGRKIVCCDDMYATIGDLLVYTK